MNLSSETTSEQPRDPRTHAVIGAAMEVHSQLGCGFLEAVYSEALSSEFVARSIPHAREAAIPINYKGVLLPVSYRADFVCFEAIIVEVKSIAQLSNVEYAQIINYLKGTGMNVGLLLNFGARSLEWKRFVRS